MSPSRAHKTVPVATTGGRVSSTPSGFTSLSSGYAFPVFQYIEVPANTPIATPVVTSFAVPVGTVNRIWIEFPAGCAGLVGVALWRGAQQFFPLPYPNWLRSDDSILSFAYAFDIISDPLTVECYAYNLDDTYNHLIWIALEMTGGVTEALPGIDKFIAALRSGG